MLLTGASPYAFQGHPALADNGSRLVFHCGPVAYGLEGTALCEVGVSGADFRVVLTPAEGPGGNTQNALHHPDYAPDGGIVFEADWNGEQIWRLPAGGGAPILVSTTFNNDNSPCVLPDGHIASLWLDRPGATGAHELKLMTGDGGSYDLLVADSDLFDVGLGCGDAGGRIINN